MVERAREFEIDDRDGSALVVWWDLGPDAPPEQLRFAQEVIGEIVESVSQIVDVRSGRVPERSYLTYRMDRVYLKLGSSRYGRQIQPTVAAEGYANPWWEMLQAGGAVGGGLILGRSILATIDKVLDVALKARLHQDTFRTERAGLRAEMRKSDALSEVYDQADKVSPPPEAHSRYRPSVPGHLPPDEALLALTCHRMTSAIEDLMLRLDGSGGFHTELLTVLKTAERLPVAVALQREMALLALGEIQPEQMEDRVGAAVRELRGRAAYDDHNEPPPIEEGTSTQQISPRDGPPQPPGQLEPPPPRD